MKPELIIFDCDGTLVDSEISHQLAILRILEEEKITGYDVNYCNTHFAGRGMTTVVNMIEEREGRKLPDDFTERYVRSYLEHVNDDVAPVPHAIEAVQALSAGHQICVASNGERNNVVRSVQSVGLFPLFGEERIFTKSQVARGKPFPDLFLFAADQFSIGASRCVVIEDSIPGVQAGLAAGMTTIGITAASHDPQETAENMKKVGVRHIFHSWPEILSFIGAL